MNLELLHRFIYEHREQIIKYNLQNKFRKYLKAQYELLAWHRKKLKLGKIDFELKETFFHGIPVYSYMDIRFVRQNTLEADEKKIDFILDRQSYKNNLKDNLAISTSLSILFWEIYKSLCTQYEKRLPSLAFRSDICDFILKLGFNTTLKGKKFGLFEDWRFVSDWIVDVLIDFCINFNIIF